jgi:putative nucleotidyltransferase with HDIG domain
MINREYALSIVRDYISNENLIHHMLAVESAMAAYAIKLGETVETWKITGLLHDFDWEIHPTAEEHPLAGAPILREKGIPEDIIHAIL